MPKTIDEVITRPEFHKFNVKMSLIFTGVLWIIMLIAHGNAESHGTNIWWHLWVLTTCLVLMVESFSIGFHFAYMRILKKVKEDDNENEKEQL